MASTTDENQTTEVMSQLTVDGEKIVISGISGLYPDCKSVKELADVLYNKKNPITSENQRWSYSHPEVSQKTGKVADLDRFDAQFFKVYFRQCTKMEPMSRKLLEQVYQAIFDAGINPETLSGKKVGVFIGTCLSETEKAFFYLPLYRSGLAITGCSKSMYANRISYWLNAKGPSLAVDQGSCSSTAALEQAYFAINRGECEAAIVAGVNLCIHPHTTIQYTRSIPICMDGKTKSFDSHADGCALSEAINVVFLQKSKHALRSYAEIVHIKSEFRLLSDSRNNLSPEFFREPEDMAIFLKTFYKDAGVSPDAVEYVEAFGAATPEADKSELESIDAVFCKNRKRPLPVGSVMSNIGYSDAASGISSITKVLLGYETGILAGNLHYTTPRNDVNAIRAGRICISDENTPFTRNYVAINGISMAGINSHVLLKGNDKPKNLMRYKSEIPYLVTISGRQESAVQRIMDDLKLRSIDQEELALLHNFHQTNVAGHLSRGFVILDQNEQQKTMCLKEQVDYFGGEKRPLWFVYSGMGSQWPTMGKQLMQIPIFANAIKKCQRVLEPKGVDILNILTSPDKHIFDNILNSFVGIAAVQIGLTDILKAIGIVPDKIIGHSVGELGCAYADGCLTAEEMILSAYSRGLVSITTPFILGSMAAVGLGYREVSKICPPSIEVACHNSFESSTISGPAEDMNQFVGQLVAKGIFAKEVQCSKIPYHSRYIADAGPELLRRLTEVIKEPRLRSDRWVSTSVPQHKWSESFAKYSSAEYHTNNLLNPVLFEETAQLIPSNAVLIEIAPHGLLQAILKRSLKSACSSIALTRKNHPNNTVLLLEAIGNLYMEGFTPRLQELYPKIEFPVSAGTPMLSHLVEWIHIEKWPLPLFKEAHRTNASFCEFFISTHDEESKYLTGNVVRGKILYPFAAALVAVWDTLAMSLNNVRKHISVVFYDIKLYSQPTLHEQRQLKLTVSIHRGTGRFEVTDEFTKIATGIIVKHKKIFKKHNYKDELNNKNEVLDADDIYQLLRMRCYQYTGDFRSIQQGDMSCESFLMHWNNNWVTLIDGLLQINILKQKHDGVSQPFEIRKLSIDPNEHVKHITNVDNKKVLKAQISTLMNATKCGGLLLQDVIFRSLPHKFKENVSLYTTKFIPRYNTVLDDILALNVFIQIVAENVGKQNVYVLGIENDKKIYHITKSIKEKKNISGITIDYKEISLAEISEGNSSKIGLADLVITCSVFTDNHMREILQRELKTNAFILNIENEANANKEHMGTFYRLVSSVGNLQLLRWGKLQTYYVDTVIYIKGQSDIDNFLSNMLHPNNRFRVHTSLPPPPGFSNLIHHMKHGMKSGQMQVIMSDDELTSFPESDLAMNVLKKGVIGGNYLLPLPQLMSDKGASNLEITTVGDLKTLYWVRNEHTNNSKIEVRVHYAGISKIDVLKATRQTETKNNLNHFGYDFSGITKSGDRVMGIMRNGSCKTIVNAQTDLLWPVPNHWNLEDAATVPLAYVTAFYCLSFCNEIMMPNVQSQTPKSILVHGGAGALGQALISIGLALGYEVYTTVSCCAKRNFMLKMFPTLKETNIGNSRDITFADMVLSLTNKRGCDIVINCLKGNLTEMSFKCSSGLTVDVSNSNTQEKACFGLNNLTRARSYVLLNISQLLMNENSNEIVMIQKLVSEGISLGYVRPLSRVTYSPHEVSRAFQLLTSSQHRGRVLIRLDQYELAAKSRVHCKLDSCYVIICEQCTFGILLIEKLISRGAKKFYLKTNSLPGYLYNKIREWKKSGIKVEVSNENTKKSPEISEILSKAAILGPIEGIIINILKMHDHESVELQSFLKELNSSIMQFSQSLRYIAVLTDDHTIEDINISLLQQNIRHPITLINIGPLIKIHHSSSIQFNRLCVTATDNALCSGEGSVIAILEANPEQSLLEQICTIADVNIVENYTRSSTTTLQELGFTTESNQIVTNYFQNYHDLTLNDDDVTKLTLQEIKYLEDALTPPGYSIKQGLAAFYAYIDTDELSALTEIVVMSKIESGNSGSLRDDEFDVQEKSLFIIPGLEGHHARFQAMCKRLKLRAVVLQPGLENLNETMEQTAQRYAKVLLHKMKLKDNFYVLGYETGIFVALELTALLENKGLAGTVLLLGGTPMDASIELENQLQDMKTMTKLEDEVARHTFGLMVGNNTTDFELEKLLSICTSWNEKVDLTVRTLLGKVPHSAQYARAQIEASLARLVQARRYSGPAAPLRSRLVLLRSPLSARSDHTRLHRLSLQPLTQHDILAPLSHAPDDLRCAAVINKYLDDDILTKYENKNLCETYLINEDTFRAH